MQQNIISVLQGKPHANLYNYVAFPEKKIGGGSLLIYVCDGK